MASNRFKKSIESIVSNNEGNVEEYVSNNVSINEVNNALDNIIINEIDNTLEHVLSDKQDIICDNVLSNILINIHKDEQRGKNITFYLSMEVEDAVSQIAKQNNISKSKLVDNILKQVLLEGK